MVINGTISILSRSESVVYFFRIEHTRQSRPMTQFFLTDLFDFPYYPNGLKKERTLL